VPPSAPHPQGGSPKNNRNPQLRYDSRHRCVKVRFSIAARVKPRPDENHPTEPLEAMGARRSAMGGRKSRSNCKGWVTEKRR